MQCIRKGFSGLLRTWLAPAFGAHTSEVLEQQKEIKFQFLLPGAYEELSQQSASLCIQRMSSSLINKPQLSFAHAIIVSLE